MRRLVLLLAALALGAGCTVDGGSGSSARQRQDQALKDPFRYSPDIGDRNNISGGPINNLDTKGLGRDVNSVLNP